MRSLSSRVDSIVNKLVIIGVGVIVLALYLAVNPRDRIQSSVLHLPREVIFVSIVSESNGILQNMNFYPRSELYIPFTMRPSECILADARFRDGSGLTDWSAPVEWRWGERYGVVTMDRDRTWRVTWFTAPDLPMKGHWFIIGNGEAYFDMSKGSSTILTEEQRKKLQLEYGL